MHTKLVSVLSDSILPKMHIKLVSVLSNSILPKETCLIDTKIYVIRNVLFLKEGCFKFGYNILKKDQQ